MKLADLAIQTLPPPPISGVLPPRLVDAVRESFTDPVVQQKVLSSITTTAVEPTVSRLDVLYNYSWVLVISFVVTLAVTPLMRRLAVANGVIDRPTDSRKVHRQPIAYLGGVAVFVGMLAGILYSIVATLYPTLLENFHPTAHGEVGVSGAVEHATVPVSILLGMTVIMLVGLIDDVVGISPRVKIAGQLFAAAALSVDNVGVIVAQGVLVPVAKALGIVITVYGGHETILFQIPLPFVLGQIDSIPIDVVYWVGTAIIALFVLGACNASNLIDGLDGLLSGTTAVTAGGLLFVALGLAIVDDGPRDAQRIVLCMALLGACLGFLPHNFNPATIFLGDCGSLLLGFTTIVIVLMLGDTGKTQLVVAGLVIYALPLIDTTLAIIRRRLAGKSISVADSDHLHHMLKRALGVRGAVFTLYAIAAGFALLGVAVTLTRARVVYLLALILASYIGVIAIKIARKQQIDDQAAAFDAKNGATPPAIAPAGPAPDPTDAARTITHA